MAAEKEAKTRSVDSACSLPLFRLVALMMGLGEGPPDLGPRGLTDPAN